MKYNILIYFLISVCFIGHSQKIGSINNIQIEYTVNFNNYLPVVKKGILIPNTKERKSNYYEYKDTDFDNKDQIDDPTQITKTIMIGNDLIKRNFIDLNLNTISSSETITFDKKLYLVSEKLPDFKWNINYTDKVIIGKYVCNKATTNFRGRTYIAWYTNEIPLQYGPWKFHGLPGLILEIYDETYKYEWIISKISKKSINELDLNRRKHDKEFNLKEFISYREKVFNKKMNNFKNNLKTRQERGSNASFTNHNKRQGRELVYEWENKN